MHIWRYGKKEALVGYSLVESVLSDLLRRPFDEPSSPERLFVIEASGHEFSEFALAELLAQCGLHDEAKVGFTEKRHHRKLGDMAWASGDLDAAEEHYLDITPGFQRYRKVPDYDRLIRLAFIRGEWEKFFIWMARAGFGGRYGKNKVLLGSTVVDVAPYLEMLAAVWDLRREVETDGHDDAGSKSECIFEEVDEDGNVTLVESFDEEMADEEGEKDESNFWDHLIEEELGLGLAEWESYCKDRKFHKPASIARVRERRLPIVCREPSQSRDAVKKRGDTERSRALLDYILRVDEIVIEAQSALESFSKTGEEEHLRRFVERITRSRVNSISGSILWAAIGHNSFEAEPELIQRIVESHPMIQLLAEEKRGPNDVDLRKVAG